MPKTDKPVPAYIPWKTFTEFVAHLKHAGVVPTRIDKSLMSHLPALTRGQIATTLRFLRLVGDNDSTSNGALQRVVDAYDTAEWGPVLKEHVVPAYDSIIAGLRLEVATPHQLEEGFDREVSKAVMRNKSVRFFLSLLTDACVTYSPHLLKRSTQAQPTKPSRASQRRKRASGRATSNATVVTPPAPEATNSAPTGMIDFPIPIGETNSFIRVPRNITGQQFPMVSAIVNAVEQLAKQNSEGNK